MRLRRYCGKSDSRTSYHWPWRRRLGTIPAPFSPLALALARMAKVKVAMVVGWVAAMVPGREKATATATATAMATATATAMAMGSQRFRKEATRAR